MPLSSCPMSVLRAPDWCRSALMCRARSDLRVTHSEDPRDGRTQFLNILRWTRGFPTESIELLNMNGLSSQPQLIASREQREERPATSWAT